MDSLGLSTNVLASQQWSPRTDDSRIRVDKWADCVVLFLSRQLNFVPSVILLCHTCESDRKIGII